MLRAACEMYNAWSGDVLSCFVRECGMQDEGRREKIQKLIFFIKSLQALLLPFKFTFFFLSERAAPHAKSQGPNPCDSRVERVFGRQSIDD